MAGGGSAAAGGVSPFGVSGTTCMVIEQAPEVSEAPAAVALVVSTLRCRVRVRPGLRRRRGKLTGGLEGPVRSGAVG